MKCLDTFVEEKENSWFLALDSGWSSWRRIGCLALRIGYLSTYVEKKAVFLGRCFVEQQNKDETMLCCQL
jgi:hypothetical protein